MKRGTRIVLVACLIAAVSALGMNAEAKKGKPKKNYVEDIFAFVYSDTEVPYMTVGVMPHIDTGKKVKVSYLEDDGKGGFAKIETKKATTDEEGYAYFTFYELSSQQLCLLKVKQPGTKKVKPAKFETGMDCQTGEISAG